MTNQQSTQIDEVLDLVQHRLVPSSIHLVGYAPGAHLGQTLRRALTRWSLSSFRIDMFMHQRRLKKQLEDERLPDAPVVWIDGLFRTTSLSTSHALSFEEQLTPIGKLMSLIEGRVPFSPRTTVLRSDVTLLFSERDTSDPTTARATEFLDALADRTARPFFETRIA